MNETPDFSLEQLERELRSLEPLCPDPDLLGRLERRMASPASHVPAPRQAPEAGKITPLRSVKRAFSAPALRRWSPWAVAAAAAVVATVSYTRQPKTAPVLAGAEEDFPPLPVGMEPNPNFRPKSQLVPVRVDRTFQEMSDAGRVIDADHGPMRKVRVHYHNSYEFQDGNGERVQYSFPSAEEILFIEGTN